MKNISPLDFGKDSSFIFDLREKNYLDLIKDLKDINVIKPKDEDISLLEKKINDFKFNEIKEDIEINNISILPEYKDALLNFTPGIQKLTGKTKIISNIFYGFKKREKINLKKICNKFYKITGNKISKSYVSGILKNKLNIKFLKTSPKTIKLNSISSKIRGFIFLNVILNALKLKLKIIYIDESNFQIQNNHLKIWRKRGELPYFKVGSPGRRNIISAISNEELLLYQIDNGTNNSTTFLDFMKNLMEVLNEKSIADGLVVMDNCSIHLTKTLQDFYKEQNLKVLTIVPYCSEFNAIELLFGFLKQKIYKNVFSSIRKLNTFVEDQLEENATNEIINKIFIKTLITYKHYIYNNI